jgi:hypothetical protein
MSSLGFFFIHQEVCHRSWIPGIDDAGYLRGNQVGVEKQTCFTQTSCVLDAWLVRDAAI